MAHALTMRSRNGTPTAFAIEISRNEMLYPAIPSGTRNVTGIPRPYQPGVTVALDSHERTVSCRHAMAAVPPAICWMLSGRPWAGWLSSVELLGKVVLRGALQVQG